MEVKLVKRNGFCYSIPILINGVIMNFLLDTGCQKSIIFDKLENVTLGLRKRKKCIIKDSSGKITEINELAVINEIIIDNMIFKNIEFILISNAVKLYMNNYDGIVGMDLLCKINFDIDFVERSIRINGRTQNADGHEYLEVSVNSIKSTAVIDTGAKNSWISNRVVY